MIDVPVGNATRTRVVQRPAWIEADLTVTRLGENRPFFVITSAAAATRNRAWLRSSLRRLRREDRRCRRCTPVPRRDLTKSDQFLPQDDSSKAHGPYRSSLWGRASKTLL